jgi:hypothetical protein
VLPEAVEHLLRVGVDGQQRDTGRLACGAAVARRGGVDGLARLEREELLAAVVELEHAGDVGVVL